MRKDRAINLRLSGRIADCVEAESTALGMTPPEYVRHLLALRFGTNPPSFGTNPPLIGATATQGSNAEDRDLVPTGTTGPQIGAGTDLAPKSSYRDPCIKNGGEPEPEAPKATGQADLIRHRWADLFEAMDWGGLTLGKNMTPSSFLTAIDGKYPEWDPPIDIPAAADWLCDNRGKRKNLASFLRNWFGNSHKRFVKEQAEEEAEAKKASGPVKDYRPYDDPGHCGALLGDWYDYPGTKGE